MNSFVKYRISALLLVLVFSLFNIGLPIVVASCPMTETKTSSCGMCPDQSSTAAQKLTSVKNTSCCQTVIAADKNSNEFVQVKYTSNEPVKLVATTISAERFDNLWFVSPVVPNNQPLVVPIDIPIFTSSLLI